MPSFSSLNTNHNNMRKRLILSFLGQKHSLCMTLAFDFCCQTLCLSLHSVETSVFLHLACFETCVVLG